MISATQMVRKVRIVIYEGTAEWLERQLAGSMPIGKKGLYHEGASITIWEPDAITPSVMASAPKDHYILVWFGKEFGWQKVCWDETWKRWIDESGGLPAAQPQVWLELPPDPELQLLPEAPAP